MGKTKGTAFVHLVRMLRAQRAGAKAILPPDLLHYLDERILVGSWYPDDDVQRVLRYFIELVGGGDIAWERAGAMLARNDLAGVYANVLGPGATVEEVLTRISGLWHNYHDTGEELATFMPGNCKIEIRGLTIKSADYCRLIGAYNAELIHLAGGRVLAMRKLSCTSRSNRSCIWEYDWARVSAPRGGTPP
jgi:hypothetical protein